MEIFRFNRAERVIDRFDSVGATAAPVATGGGTVHVTCLVIEPGGTLGTHPAPVDQLFLVIAGEGWVAGPDGRQMAISAGDGVRWEADEEHTCGSAVGLTALALEGSSLDLFIPHEHERHRPS
ncbi:cupin domain-containing protein [Kitasatospora sp. McL0602]|uniref:cupin domain-containing protein n=1 Tax=Kitasatospora sp. McL0602 TaxID=3439530 RepID=UPI003F8A9FEB